MIYKLYIKYPQASAPCKAVGYPTDLASIIKLLKILDEATIYGHLVYLLKAKKAHNNKYMDNSFNIISYEEYLKLSTKYENIEKIKTLL